MSSVQQIKYTKHGNSSILSNIMVDDETTASEIPPSTREETETVSGHHRKSETSAAETLDIRYANVILTGLEQRLFSILSQYLSTASTADIGQIKESQILSAEGEFTEQLWNLISSFRTLHRAYFEDNQFTYHSVAKPTSTPSQKHDEITVVVNKQRRKMSLDAARTLISESQVNPDDPIFSLGGKVSAKQGTVLESEHDEEIYGLER
ncbi:MAG: hypothetical protein R6V83_09085 [Candidatus Thorarchaeota archaeon]